MQTIYNCPLCEERKGTPDTKGHLYFYGEDRGWHCFRCEAHANKGYPPKNAEQVLGSADSIGHTEIKRSYDEAWKNPLKMTKPAWDFIRARRYLLERGLDYKTIEKAKLLYTAFGPLSGRVIFPIYPTLNVDTIFENTKPKILYYVARAVHKTITPKYKNAVGGKGNLVYPVGDFRAETIVVVEGVFDAFAVNKVGFAAAALLGKRLNTGQCIRLYNMAKRAILLLDEDAYHSSLTVQYKLKYYMPTKRITLPKGLDPDRFLREKGLKKLKRLLNG